MACIPGTANARPAHQKLALHKAGHYHCTFRTCRARPRLAAQGSDLRCTSGLLRPSGFRPEPLGLALHPRYGACTSGSCLTHQKLAMHKAGHFHWTFSTRRARQRLAPQGNDLRCTSGAAPTPKVPTSTLGTCALSQARRFQVRRLPVPPETGLAQGRPLALHLQDLEGASATSTARQRSSLNVGGCYNPPGTRSGSLGLALHRRHVAGTSGDCLFLHAETGLAQGQPLVLHLLDMQGASATSSAGQ